MTHFFHRYHKLGKGQNLGIFPKNDIKKSWFCYSLLACMLRPCTASKSATEEYGWRSYQCYVSTKYSEWKGNDPWPQM